MAMLVVVLLLGLFSSGLSLVCDTCQDKCGCYNNARDEFCPPDTFCYTVTNFLGQPIRKGCSEDCNAFSGQCTRCGTDYCNRTPRTPYPPSGYEDCDQSGSGIGSGVEYGGGRSGGSGGIGQGVSGVYGNGGSGGIGHGVGGVYGNGGSGGIGQGVGGVYGGGGSSGIGSGVYGSGGSQTGQGVYGGNQGQGGMSGDRYGSQYGQGQGGIGTGVSYGGQPRPGQYRKGSCCTGISSAFAVLGAVYLMA